GPDLPPDDGERGAAAGVAQHDAVAADTRHHPVPGHLAGLRAVADGFLGRRLQDRPARWSSYRNVPVCRGDLPRGVLHRVTAGETHGKPNAGGSMTFVARNAFP